MYVASRVSVYTYSEAPIIPTLVTPRFVSINDKNGDLQYPSLVSDPKVLNHIQYTIVSSITNKNIGIIDQSLRKASVLENARALNAIVAQYPGTILV